MTTKAPMPAACWEQFDKTRKATGTAVPPEGDTAEELVWRGLTGGVGEALINWLRAEVIEHRTPQTAPDAQFRWDEAQRALVDRLEKMRDRGAIIARARSQTKT